MEDKITLDELLHEVVEVKYQLVTTIKKELGDKYKDLGSVAQWLHNSLDREEMIAAILGCLYQDMNFYSETKLDDE